MRSAGKPRGQRLHGVADLLGHLDGIGARRLVDADRGRRRAVEAAVAILRLGAHFDARDVLDPHHRAVRIGAQDDVGELFRVGEPALGLDVELNLLQVCDRRRADAAKRRLDVLALHRGDDVVRRQIERGQPIRIEPDPQRIIQRSEQHDLADAFDARQRVDDVDGRVIAEIHRVVGVLRRVDIDDLQQRRRFLAARRDPSAGPHSAAAAARAGAVLHVDGVDVRIGAEREGDIERVAAVGAAGGLVIERVVDAVDLLFDRLRDRGLDRLGVGARIIRRQRDLRRHDVGKLRDRDRRDRDEARQRDDDGNDDGEARPVDENSGKHRVSFPELQLP